MTRRHATAFRDEYNGPPIAVKFDQQGGFAPEPTPAIAAAAKQADRDGKDEFTIEVKGSTRTMSVTYRKGANGWYIHHEPSGKEKPWSEMSPLELRLVKELHGD